MEKKPSYVNNEPLQIRSDQISSVIFKIKPFHSKKTKF